MKRKISTSLVLSLMASSIIINNNCEVKAIEYQKASDYSEVVDFANESVEEKTYTLANGEVLTSTITIQIIETEDMGTLFYAENVYAENKKIVMYRYEDIGYSYQEFYENNELIKTLVFGRNGRATIPDRVTEETALGWGYSSERDSDNRSYACPYVLVQNGTYRRRNIEVTKYDLPEVQDEFSTDIYMIVEAEADMEATVSSLIFDATIGKLSDILGVTFGDVVDAIESVETAISLGEIAADAADYALEISEHSANLFNCYDALSEYDHLD